MTTTIGSLDLNAFSDLYSDSTQYFWFESDATATYGAGAHVTLVPDTSFISNPTGQNILMNTEGFSIRNGLLPMMTLDNDSLDFNVVNTTAGTYVTTATFTSTGAQIGQSTGAHLELNANEFSIRNGSLPMMTLDNDSLDFNVVNTTAGTYVTTATFSSTGAQIGQTGESHIEMDYHSMQLVDRDGNLYFYVSDLRDRDGNVYIEDTIESTGQLRAYRLSHICDTTKSISVYVNGSLVSDENYSIGFNQMLQTSRIDFTYTPPIGTIIVEYYAIGQNAKALTFGIRNGEVGAMSVGLGYNVVADGTYSFAEGQESVASGATSHAEGWGTLAGSSCCHAEGNHTKALGANSHASGYFTQANYYQQFVCGAYNDNKSGNVFEIGNGSADDARSNALTVDWSGNITINNHDSEIGHVYSASKSVAISNTGIDHDTDGASLTLSAGVYIVVGQWQFNTRSTTGTTNSAIRMYRSSDNYANNIAQQRMFSATNAWSCLQCTAIVELTSTETIKVCGATSRPYTLAQNTYITAIRIK